MFNFKNVTLGPLKKCHYDTIFIWQAVSYIIQRIMALEGSLLFDESL